MGETPLMTKEEPIRSYGRVKGRALKPRQARLMQTLLPAIEIPAEGPIDPGALFSDMGASLPAGGGGAREERRAEKGANDADALRPDRTLSSQKGGGVALEIGFGGGEHLVAQAQARPDCYFLGVEPFLNGVASCLRHIEEAVVSNIRLRQGDARDALARLPDASLDRVYLLFPDPWPKKRHWKRRLIQSDFITELARVLKPNGEVRFATDWKDYAAWTLELFLSNASFSWPAERAEAWRTPWAGHRTTRYEQKRLGDTTPVYLRFMRIGTN